MNESTRLSARDWSQAALKAMSEGGLAAVAVEPLARTLGVTKGSFYAHYRNRDELIAAALGEWVQHGAEGIAGLAAIADPEERLRELFTVVVGAVQPQAASVSLLGDRHDPRVRDAIFAVNESRLELLADTYRELGLPPERAESRARVVYAAILGLLHLARTDPDSPPPTMLADEATAIFLQT